MNVILKDSYATIMNIYSTLIKLPSKEGRNIGCVGRHKYNREPTPDVDEKFIWPGLGSLCERNLLIMSQVP